MVGERALWLGLSGLSEREFLDVPVELKALFGAAVTNMHQQWDLCKKDACILGFPLLLDGHSQGTET